ncbi:hypothetical protein LshimejAT787_1104510 [Lyophyllum shimeji]|uniref:F-box domain-containing protein n=1 Tax=Lyophyllum shimeji TaxID=47721 RepID=A0A9P3PWE3_LYOSH|nr:hypothetical protein LshimejAT787_1104510 [Lyophyllum shimeji]
MIIAGDNTNHHFLTKFPLRTFLPLPSFVQRFANSSGLAQQKCLEAGLSDHARSHRHAVEPPPPINRLPVELLADVFFLSLQDNRVMKGPPRSRKFPGLSFSPGWSSDPMILASVCRHWRAVALTTPMLWSSLAILCSQRKHHIPLLRTWLERSADCPLTICLVEPFRESKERAQWWPQQQALATDILSLLITQAYRWKAIDFRFSLGIPVVLANIPHGTLRALESATIFSSEGRSLSPLEFLSLDQVWEAVHASPSLRKARWEAVYLEHRLQDIPCTQLTSIEVTISIDSLFDLLSLCHNLVDLHFTDARLESDADSPPRSSNHPHSHALLVLPHLRNLSLDLNQPSATIFGRLTLPSLISFDIRQDQSCREPSDASSFKDLLARSKCCLQKFSYEDTGPDGEDILLEMLSSPLLSSLADLSVESSVSTKFTNLLTRQPAMCATLPRLERLALGQCATPPGALRDMVSSRRIKTDHCSLLREMKVGNWARHDTDL